MPAKNNCFPFLVWPIMTPFLYKLGPIKQLIRGFTNQLFFRTTELQHNLLILIESSNIFHWKSAKRVKWIGLWNKIWVKFGPMLWKKKDTGISMGCFWYFAWGMHLQARSSGGRNTWVKINKQKLKNTISEGN